MNDRPKRRPISEAFRRMEVERVESAIHVARWAISVDLATFSASIFDGFEISGDHRPRHGRLYACGSDDGER